MKNLPAPVTSSLPGTIPALHEYVLLSGEKLKAYKLVLKSASRQGAKDIYDRTLAEAQIVGESALHAEARMGEMLEAMPKVTRREPSETGRVGGREKSLPPGVNKKASHHAQQLARNPKAIKAAVEAAKKQGDVPTRKTVLSIIKHGIHYSSKTPEHYTPKNVLDAVIACMGAIDMDPCSNEGVPNVPAINHYTRADDGLSKTWKGRVFMNPPYGDEIEPWPVKLVDEYRAGNATEAIALVAARTDTRWFRKFRDFPVCFIAGRLKFVGNENSAQFPSALVYLGKRRARFLKHFRPFGDVWERCDEANGE